MIQLRFHCHLLLVSCNVVLLVSWVSHRCIWNARNPETETEPETEPVTTKTYQEQNTFYSSVNSKTARLPVPRHFKCIIWHFVFISFCDSPLWEKCKSPNYGVASNHGITSTLFAWSKFFWWQRLLPTFTGVLWDKSRTTYMYISKESFLSVVYQRVFLLESVRSR